MSNLSHVRQVSIAREKIVGVGYYSQFQEEVVFGISATLWDVVYPKLGGVFFKELHKPLYVINIKVARELGAHGYILYLINKCI